jgi:hypothetical protein
MGKCKSSDFLDILGMGRGRDSAPKNAQIRLPK